MKYTKEYILSGALKQFNVHGVVNVRLQNIADAASISVGHLAYHFRNKDTIIETLYDQLKKKEEIVLKEFRSIPSFDNVNFQLQKIFDLQKEYIFFYVDTLEILRAHLSIKEKHQAHINWQVQQIYRMIQYNVSQGSFVQPVYEDQYQMLAWQVWMMIDNWMYARQTSGLDHLSFYDFLRDVRSLLVPFVKSKPAL
jgi:AcrR family transcriptional regulator